MLTDTDVLKLSHELTHSGHWYVDLRDNSVLWSEEVFRLHGRDPSAPQPTMEEAISFYHPEDRDRVAGIVENAIRSHEPFTFTARIVRMDGAERRVRTVGRVKLDSADRPTWLFGVFRDITEEWQRQTHQRRLSRVIEQTNELIVMTDRDGYIEWVNPSFSRVTSYSPEEYLGQKPGDLLQGPETDQETIERMHQKLAAAEPFSAEVLNYTRDKKPYWIRFSCHPDYDEDGEHVGFSSIQSDVTLEKDNLLKLEREIQRRKALEAKYRHLANHDELSGLYNRRYFFAQGEVELRRCQRYASPLSVLMLDFDEFKALNDSHGHEAGDKVIEIFGKLFNEILREHDLPARLGGEEFVALLPETPLDGVRRVAERVRTALQAQPVTLTDGIVFITASIGIAEAGQDEDSLQSLINKADSAMYLAKRSGRNQVREAGQT
jgi:diguanylate cyclase